MKIIFAHFEIAKYGGIVEEIENRMQSFKDLGHEVDIVRLTYSKDESLKRFDKLNKELEDGSYFNGMKKDSQRNGMEKGTASGYWKNSYYGWVLKPYTNLIPTKHPNALKMWNDKVADADLIFWSFMPTKCKESEGFNDWYKYFDLPESTQQFFVVHDGYFDVRSAWVTALKDKIKILECVHLAAFHSCKNIEIPRRLGLSPRVFPDSLIGSKSKSERKIDFFSAHIFKSMKKMDELIRCIPHCNEGEKQYSFKVGGADIEYNYMTSKDKTKENYRVNLKTDPDINEEFVGERIWDVAIVYGMDYEGLLPKQQMDKYYKNSKFFIDPSWSSHYAQYNRTNINSSLIEAVINGCYPVVRDYKGLEKQKFYDEDEIFNQIRAIVIPWDATPKQFAEYLKKAVENITDEQYDRDTKHNFELFKNLSGADVSARKLLNIYEGELEDLTIGEDSDEVILQTYDVMNNWFKIELPIKFEK